jgi:hypothetical protein
MEENLIKKLKENSKPILQFLQGNKKIISDLFLDKKTTLKEINEKFEKINKITDCFENCKELYNLLYKTQFLKILKLLSDDFIKKFFIKINQKEGKISDNDIFEIYKSFENKDFEKDLIEFRKNFLIRYKEKIQFLINKESFTFYGALSKIFDFFNVFSYLGKYFSNETVEKIKIYFDKNSYVFGIFEKIYNAFEDKDTDLLELKKFLENEKSDLKEIRNYIIFLSHVLQNEWVNRINFIINFKCEEIFNLIDSNWNFFEQIYKNNEEKKFSKKITMFNFLEFIKLGFKPNPLIIKSNNISKKIKVLSSSEDINFLEKIFEVKFNKNPKLIQEKNGIKIYESNLVLVLDEKNFYHNNFEIFFKYFYSTVDNIKLLIEKNILAIFFGDFEGCYEFENDIFLFNWFGFLQNEIEDETKENEIFSEEEKKIIKSFENKVYEVEDYEKGYTEPKELLKDYEKSDPKETCYSFLNKNEKNLGVENLKKIIEECKNNIPKIKERLNIKNFTNKLTDDEIFTILVYTYDLNEKESKKNFYYIFNEILRLRNNEETKIWLGYVYYFFQALDKLPDESVTVYRGISNKTVTDIYLNAKIGSKIHWSAFTSATKNEKVAKHFATKKGIVFEIKANTGKFISPFAFFENEEEILLLPNRKFIYVEKKNKKDGYVYVNLVEESDLIVDSILKTKTEKK